MYELDADVISSYSWFLSTWDNYPFAIERADAIRYFVVYHFGGLYIDLDNASKSSPTYDTTNSNLPPGLPTPPHLSPHPPSHSPPLPTHRHRQRLLRRHPPPPIPLQDHPTDQQIQHQLDLPIHNRHVIHRSTVLQPHVACVSAVLCCRSG